MSSVKWRSGVARAIKYEKKKKWIGCPELLLTNIECEDIVLMMEIVV